MKKIKRKRKGYRLSFFWEEFGTPAEGGMEDCTDLEIERPPTKEELHWIERSLCATLGHLKLLVRRK